MQTMDAYIAMLRGVNVTGHNTIKMKDLRGLFQGLGFRNVETYIQSGNIVFQIDTPVIVRTSKEMRNVIANNPFLKEKGIDSSKLHVTFLSEIAQRNSVKKLETLATSPDRFYPASHEIYLYCPGGYGRTKLSNNAIEKALSVEATTRNWKTTNALFEMVSKL